ncbi:unnamed protein product [Effrenium voratum]|nr:unnamed protein product [Effrenium voratum]
MVLIEDVDEEEEREALKAAAKAASQQWRRIQVVQEDSDDDAPVAPAASEQSVQHSGVSDPCPDLSILCSRAGAEEAKRHGNRLFGEGKVAECERWFSKALWLYESGRVRDFPGDLRCALHSNRALARLKLQRFRDAEEDCSAALEDNPQNAKARYRRAMARLELGKLVPGLEDVERALKELPEDSRQEAQDLKVRIQEQLATPEGPAGTAKQPTPKGREKKEPTKAEDSGYKRIHVKEVDEDKKEASKPETTAEKTHVNGHAQQEPYPDIQLEPTMQGAEKAKQRANELFQKGSLEESARWFSKAIWLLESGKVPGATASLRSVLHSNRAFARSKLQQWTGVEEDCTEALALNESNAKALYRRSQARLELNKLDAALEDVQQLLPLLAAPADQEAQDLKKRILEQQAKAKKTLEKAKEASVKAEQRDDAKAQPPAGFKRMEIVEASDSEEEETKAAAKVEAPKAVLTSSQDQKDKEMFPELKFEFSRKGVEAAKNTGGQLFSKQDLQGASRHFSKALWMLQSGKVADAQSDASWCNSTRLALHLNRAFSELRQENWRAAEDDCTEALKIDPQANLIWSSRAVKALYRRAMAREKMGRAAEALKDVDEALKLQPGAEELVALQKRLKPAPKAETGFKRMEIVEASDDDEEAQEPSTQATSASTSPKAQEAGPPADSEPCEPWDELEPTLAGVEKGKEMGNRLFSEGKIEECERWFSKAIWLAEESGKVNVPSDLRGILHSNRAFARLRLQQWLLAEEDCTQALVLNASNSKALYRRAQARLELGKRSMALEDVDKLLPMLAPPSDRDAQELRERILALPESPAKKAEMFPDLHFEFSRKGVEAAKDAGSQLFSKQDLQGASRHFSKALWMLESGKVADAESDASWCNSTRLALHSNRAFSELRQGNWQAAEEDCTEALKINPQAVKALYRRAIAREELGRKEEALKDAEAALALQPGEELVALQKRLKAATETPGVEAVKRTETEAKAPSASPTPKEAPEPEPFDDIKLEPTLAGVEKGKEMGNKLFSAGKFEECERCFSKALWLAQESGKVKAPNDIRGILHSNRAFARLRLQRWSDAEKDCDEALRLNERNAKALYRRAMARQQLEKPKAALADLEQLLPMLDGNSNKDALALKEELLAQLRPSSPKALQKEAAKPAEAQRPASAPVRTVSAAPSMPSTSPKSGMELLRQFKSLKKNPEVLTKYVTEKVPPSLLQSLFSRSPIEADDLALVLQTLRTAASAAEPLPGPRVGEYLQQLLRTHGAGTQFSMLSSSEKQLVRELVAMVPGSSGDDLKQSFTKVL